MANKLIVSLSPHVHSGDSVQRNMCGVCIALIPALLCSFYFFGLSAIIVTGVSVLSCLFFEWFINKFLLRHKDNTITDGSAIITGLLLAFNLPSNIPLWMVLVGALFAIGVVKMTFGGLGCNLFNPALAARAFMLISFPVEMTTWPIAGQDFVSYVDAQTGATPLAIIKDAAKTGDVTILNQLPSALDMLIGRTGGCIGEVCALAILVGLIFMLSRRIITWHIPISIIATVFLTTGIMHVLNPAFASPIVEILSGGLMLGAVFMATDYVTSPMTPKGQLIYGVAIGFLTVIIRTFGAYPEGMSFAILIMNAFTPIINNYCKPERFGAVEGSKK